MVRTEPKAAFFQQGTDLGGRLAEEAPLQQVEDGLPLGGHSSRLGKARSAPGAAPRCRRRYSDARGTPKARHAAAVPNGDLLGCCHQWLSPSSSALQESPAAVTRWISMTGLLQLRSRRPVPAQPSGVLRPGPSSTSANPCPTGKSPGAEVRPTTLPDAVMPPVRPLAAHRFACTIHRRR